MIRSIYRGNRNLRSIRKMTGSTESPIIFAPKTYQYKKGHLEESDLDASPIEQFHRWFDDVRQASGDGAIPEACTFSTARLPSGRISSRVVLFKELDPHGFIVYSNWDGSKKAADYATNKHAALTFFWPQMERQVRVEGVMEPVSRETSERYFQTRPRGSKIGAWASPQLQLLHERQQLDNLYAAQEKRFEGVADEDIPCPPKWGGMRVVPLEVEFWQGRVSRLHDRISFRREATDASWNRVRLAP